MSPPVEIRTLARVLLPDFLSFFDGAAFADNPAWRSCYCQFMYVDPARGDWDSRTGAQNRAAAGDRICSRRMQGLLAYRDGVALGWCHAGPRALMAGFAARPDADADADADRIGEITCFVVAKAQRRTGVATALLRAACAMLEGQGLAIAEAWPRAEPGSDAKAYHGPLGMYLGAGFRIHRREDDGSVCVRRSLG
jgi:ribosomal protein S18 acetylase RimI-like enzyme